MNQKLIACIESNTDRYYLEHTYFIVQTFQVPITSNTTKAETNVITVTNVMHERLELRLLHCTQMTVC
jgi:hypothetical protein